MTETVSNEQLMKAVENLTKKVNKVQRGLNASSKPEDGEPPKPRNNGFNKKEVLSEALCSFLELPAGSMLARPEVTKKISEYVKANGLQNGKEIKLDTRLFNLLQTTESVTYFTLQRHLKVHFIRNTDPSTSAPPPIPDAPVPPEKKKRAAKASVKK